MVFANPEKTHFESNRYAADDQYGLINLDMPSYKKCQPISARNVTSP